MAKVNFSKVEKSFDRSLQKVWIDNLAELAAIVNVIQDPAKKMTTKAIEDIIVRFQKELKKIKKQDPLLFKRLDLTPQEEERFNLPFQEYAHDDWLRLKALKLRLDEVRKELYGQETIDAENDARVTKERKRHINKRFNIREGWLPLH